MQTENLSYEDVASWEPTEEYLNEAMQWVEPPSDFKPKKKIGKDNGLVPKPSVKESWSKKSLLL